MKKYAVLILALIMIFAVCACGTEKPLSKVYKNQKIEALDKSLPDKVDISVSTDEVDSSIIGTGDKELIRKTADAFMKITAGEETAGDGFKAKYSLSFFWEDEKISLSLSDDTAEITDGNGTRYYRIGEAQELISLLTQEAKLNESTFENSEKALEKNGVRIDVMKDGSYDENGRYTLSLYVVNENTNTVGIMLAGCKVDGKETESPEILYVSGNSELGFKVPVENSEGAKKISFRFDVGFGTGEPLTPAFSSDEYVIKP